MSAFSDAWSAMDPDIRQFFVNFASLRCQFTNHVLGDQTFPYFGYYWRDGHAFLGFRGIDVASRGFTDQLFLTGKIDPNYISWYEQDMFDGPEILPFFSVALFESWGDQFKDIPELADNWPRERYRPRKSYWTGAPRSRRNL